MVLQSGDGVIRSDRETYANPLLLSLTSTNKTMNFYRLYTPIRPTLRPRAEWLFFRPLSTTFVRQTTLGYGDMWDSKDNRPDHGEFRDNENPNDEKAQGKQAKAQAQAQPQDEQDQQQQKGQQSKHQKQQEQERQQEDQQGLQPKGDGQSTNHSMLLEQDKVDKEEYVSGSFWAGDVGGKHGKPDEFLEVDDDILDKIARDRAATDAEHFPTDKDVGSQ